MRLSLSIPSCTLPGTHPDGVRDGDKWRIREDTTHCTACRVTVGQSVNHRDTDGIHVHIRTFSLFVVSVDIVVF